MKKTKKRCWIIREIKLLIYPTPKRWKRIAIISGSVTGAVAAGLVAVQTIPALDNYLHDGFKQTLAYLTFFCGFITYMAQRHIKTFKK